MGTQSLTASTGLLDPCPMGIWLLVLAQRPTSAIGPAYIAAFYQQCSPAEETLAKLNSLDRTLM